MSFDVREFFHGAVSVENRDGVWTARRFTEDSLRALGALDPMYERLGRCTAGVRLVMRTSSPRIAFSWRTQGFYTSAGGFDIWENGTLVSAQTLPSEPACGRFEYAKESPGESLLEIWLPANSACSLSDFELGDARPVPEDRPLVLFCGDSITQSAYTPNHSLAFASSFARMSGMSSLNRGVGSLYYDASTLDAREELHPEIVFAEFGANDLYLREENGAVVYRDGMPRYRDPREIPAMAAKADAYLGKLGAMYPAARIAVTTLTWCVREPAEELRQAYDAALREVIRSHGFRVIEGRALTPRLEECRVADGTHFSNLGGLAAAAELYRIMTI